MRISPQLSRPRRPVAMRQGSTLRRLAALPIAALVLTITTVALAGAQADIRLGRHVVAGGGGRSAAGGLVAAGTIGQSVVDSAAGSPGRVGSGFWAPRRILAPPPATGTGTVPVTATSPPPVASPTATAPPTGQPSATPGTPAGTATRTASPPPTPIGSVEPARFFVFLAWLSQEAEAPNR